LHAITSIEHLHDLLSHLITHGSVLARLRIGEVQEKPGTIRSLQSVIYQDDENDGIH
jgi:hypothetical protein